MTKFKYLLIALTVLCACASQKPVFNSDVYLYGTIKPVIKIRRDSLTFFDSSRKRAIPTAIYQLAEKEPKKLAIINTGYGATRGDYSYIAMKLARVGYLVVTIQHDLPGDDTLPRTGDLYKLRKPFWDRGLKSIFFATGQLQRRYPDVDFDDILLLGHSNGGDMVMLIAAEYPKFATKIISLDNRRAPIPRTRHPQLFSIRSSDQPADSGVLPSADEQKKYHIKIVRVSVKHNDMGGSATDAQKNEITTHILNFLGE